MAAGSISRPHPASFHPSRPPSSTLFPYTTLFRSSSSSGWTPMPEAPQAGQATFNFKAAITQMVQRNASDLLLKVRSEEHTSELQSPYDLVCRLLLEKKN